MLSKLLIKTKVITIWLLSKPELVFVSLALTFGLLFVFIFAPLNGTDEFSHFPRVYQISQGQFWEQKLPGDNYGGNLPSNVNNMINDYRNLSRISPGPSYFQTRANLNKEYGKLSNPGSKKVPAIFTSIVLYPPWAYFPSLIGLLIAKALALPLIWYVYLARITNLFIWLALTYFAIRLLPAGKWFLVALALVPTALSQAATVSGDGILMSLSWFLIALVLAFSASKIKANWRWLCLTTIVALYVAVIKDGYFLLGLLPLAIPAAAFASKKRALVYKSELLLLIAAAAGLFTLRTIHVSSGVVLTPTVGMFFNSHDQITYILHHLSTFVVHVLIQPFSKSFDTTYQGIVGILTNRLIYLSILVMSLIYFGLLLGYSSVELNKQIARYRKWQVPFFIGVFFLSYCLLETAFYIGASSVGAAYVFAFYGRYFLPLIPLLLIVPLSFNIKFKLPKNYYGPAISLIAMVGLIAMIMSLK